MRKSVSNDALWEKLSEVDKKLEILSANRNYSDSNEIAEVIHAFSQSNNAYFEENKKNITIVNKNVLLSLKRIANIQEQIESHAKQQKRDKVSYFELFFFKIRKSSAVITALALLVFILTLFCMKQQNDYSILNGEYYRKRIEIGEMWVETDSLKNTIKPSIEKKK